MTTPSAPADTTPAASTPASAAVRPAPAPPSWPWRRADPGRRRAADHHFGSGDSRFPLAATWWSLLLAIAPAPLAAAAAFAPAPANLVAAVVGVLVLVAGIAGGILHIGLLFVPALAVLAVGTVKLWREQR